MEKAFIDPTRIRAKLVILAASSKDSLGIALGAVIVWSPAFAQVPDARGSQIPTLAPVVKATTPSVVNISVHARVKEDNPLYRDPVFREFF
jgi:serine protease Do